MKETSARLFLKDYDLPDSLANMWMFPKNQEDDCAQWDAWVQKNDRLLHASFDVLNSAWFDYPRPFSSVSDAAVVLGSSAVKAVVVSLALAHYFKEKAKDAKSILDRADFWRSALSTAVIAQSLAKLYGHVDSYEIFLIAFTKQIGRWLMNQTQPDAMRICWDLVQHREMSWGDAEKEVWGISEQTVSLQLAQQWRLPLIYSSVWRHWLKPSLAESDREAATLVHLADILAKALGWVDLGFASFPEADEPSLEALNISPLQCAQSLSFLDERRKKASVWARQLYSFSQ